LDPVGCENEIPGNNLGLAGFTVGSWVGKETVLGTWIGQDRAIQPWQLILIGVAGCLNPKQQQVIDYLLEENRDLREQIGAGVSMSMH
jgi:hypothetical protein